MYCSITLISLLIFFTVTFLINIANNTDSNTFLTTIIPVILGFQLFIIILQTINQFHSNRISTISCLPHLIIKAKVEPFVNKRGRTTKEPIIIRLFNNGMDAHNVGYSVRIDKKIIKQNVPLFILSKEDNVEIYRMSKEDFKRQRVDIKVGFEGISVGFKYAYFKKDVGELTFRTVVKGI